MIRGSITGTPNQINSVVGVLRKVYASNFEEKVNIDLPEAAMYGTGVYIAAFTINERYLDYHVFDKIFLPKIELEFNNGKRCTKEKRSNYWKWEDAREALVLTSFSYVEPKTQMTKELQSFEELEQWEARIGDTKDD